jgi:hypothetical protein
MNNTKVINVKVKYIRPEYNNLKEWCQDPKNVYIGRKGIVIIDKQRYPKVESIFANPFKVGVDGDRDKCIRLYRSYLHDMINEGSISTEDIEELRVKI